MAFVTRRSPTTAGLGAELCRTGLFGFRAPGRGRLSRGGDTTRFEFEEDRCDGQRSRGDPGSKETHGEAAAVVQRAHGPGADLNSDSEQRQGPSQA